MIDLLGMPTGTDPGAFFEEFYPRVYAFVFGQWGGLHEDVEEIVQDALLHAWRDRERFRSEAAPLTWIKAIARHRLLEKRRKQSRKDRAEEVLQALERMDTALLPDRVLHSGELRAAVWSALEAIGPAYAGLLVRRYLDQKSVPSIAQELGESEKAVESRLHRAREAFRKSIHLGDER
jgi:RNA polymerase sigma-70 factor (ECF subfamily)